MADLSPRLEKPRSNVTMPPFNPPTLREDESTVGAWCRERVSSPDQLWSDRLCSKPPLSRYPLSHSTKQNSDSFRFETDASRVPGHGRRCTDQISARGGSCIGIGEDRAIRRGRCGWAIYCICCIERYAYLHRYIEYGTLQWHVVDRFKKLIFGDIKLEDSAPLSHYCITFDVLAPILKRVCASWESNFRAYLFGIWMWDKKSSFLRK